MAALMRNVERRLAHYCRPLWKTTYCVYRIQRRNIGDIIASSSNEDVKDNPDSQYQPETERKEDNGETGIKEDNSDQLETLKTEKPTPWTACSTFPEEIKLSPIVLATKGTEQFSVRRHPGKMTIKTVKIPDKLERAVNNVLDDTNESTAIIAKAKKLKGFLDRRLIPLSDAEITSKAQKLEDKVLKKKPEMSTRLQELSTKEGMTKEETEEFNKLKSQLKSEVLLNLRRSTYHTLVPVYNSEVCLQYMVARIAENYSVILKCLSEIKARDPDYHPNSIFDMGSGLGTTVWKQGDINIQVIAGPVCRAVHNVWREGYKQLYCVDSSTEMIKLSSLLLRGANPQGDMIFPNVYLRNNMPSPRTNRYTMVVCAHTLFDISDQGERTALIKDLWEMTIDYIIIVEDGTYQGHVLVQEARALILKQARKDREEAHVFAPCPHDRTCPMLQLKKHKVGCKTQVKYRPLQINGEEGRQEKFSYVIIKKGPLKGESSSWPRLIKRTNRKVKHLHCYACCPDGKLGHYVLSKTRHREIYPLAKFTDWGDLLPVEWPENRGRWLFDSDKTESNECESDEPFQQDSDHSDIESDDDYNDDNDDNNDDNELYDNKSDNIDGGDNSGDRNK